MNMAVKARAAALAIDKQTHVQSMNKLCIMPVQFVNEADSRLP